MADEFKTYDKTPIVGVVHISRWSFGLREVILAIIAALLLLMVLIFAGLFGKAESELAGGPPSASAIVGNSFCMDVGCLKTATRALELMNKSVDPCDNFYEYACGNYKNVRPVLPNDGSRNVFSDMAEENQDRLINIIEKPISRLHDWASERKLKQFFQSCNDMFTREKNRGLPFLTKIVSELGGWKLIGNWDEQNWDFNNALKKVQSEFWVDALYSPRVNVDAYDYSKRTIEIAPAGTGKFMTWSWYISSSPRGQQVREDYKKFIRRVGSLFFRDAQTMTPPLGDASKRDQYLEEFVNDTFSLEYNIASIADSSRYRNDPYLETNKVSLRELNTETGNVIDWVSQMSYLFNTAGVTGSTKVVLLRREYFQNMTAMISSLPDADRKRMLHNYLIWRVAEVYVQELSWEYIHANREIYEDLFNKANFMGVYKYCFSTVKFYMDDALGALYIADHFSPDSRKTVVDITDNIKLALQTQLEKTPWMDDATKQYAKEKLNSVSFKMGYPDWMANQGYVDELFNGLTVNVSDFFGNLISANQYKRAEWNDQLTTTGKAREEWVYPAYLTTMNVYWFWNEVAAPAGILQFPVYSANQPHSATFGALGSLLGRYLHHVVDEWGQWYDKSGDLVTTDEGTWWSNKSLTAYDSVRDCVYNIFNNITQIFVQPDGSTVTKTVNAGYYTPRGIAWINGIRLAQIGYKDWIKSKAISEKMLPGLGMTNEQMVYLAHAQVYCSVQDPNLMYNPFRLSDDAGVNMALGQLQEFSDAFQCNPGTKMNHAKKCDYY